MSFYDDASLVFLPSGGAGKDGKAYSIKPVPEYGTNLVTNGGFATDSDWTKTNATISGGVATITSTGYAYAAIVQNNVLTIGKTYYATIDVNSIVGGLIVGTSETITNSGIASVTFTATNTYLDIRRDSSFATTTAEIDNVSVKEVVVGDGDFTFSRGSNLTVTRVDSNGLIEKGRENLLLQSNSFDTTWNNDLGTGGSIQDGQTGYDGSSDAWLITKNKSLGRINQGSISFDGVSTFSVYVKAGDSDYIVIQAFSNYAYFDLTTGLAQNETSGVISATSTDVGNGWYRCSIVFNISASSSVYIYPAENGSVGGTSGSIYIQDAQVEQGLVATEYIESGATKGKSGLLENEPRFDYSGGASCPSLLLEPSRTSLYQYSEYISNFQGTNTFNAANSPEGVSNAILLTKTSASDQFVNISWSGSSLSTETEYTMSLFVKYNGYDVDVRYEYNNFNDWGKGWNALFQVRSSGVTASTTASCTSDVKDYGNGWYRIIVNVETAASITPTASSNLVRIIGASADEVLIYGAGMEQGSYPTSYIPNHSGGSVTRAADSCSGAGDASTFNDSEGVLYAEIAALANDGGIRYLSLSDGGSNNRVVILFDSAADRIRAIVSSGGVKYFDENTESYDVLNYNKIAVRYKQDDFSLWVNGTNVASVSSGSSPIGLNELSYNLGGSNTIFSKSKQLIVFNTALSTADCEILTGATAYESFSAMATALNYTTYE